MRKAERNLQRERHRCAAAAASLAAPPEGEAQPGTLLSPPPLTLLLPPPPRKPRAGGCTACPRAAAAGARALPHPPPARLPRAAPAPPPPRPAHRRRRRPPQPNPAPARPLARSLARSCFRSLARVRALPRTRPPRASLGARSRPRGPGRRDHVDGWAPSSPAPSPVVECVESKRLGAGRAREPRACALGRPGLRTGGGGRPRGVGRGRAELARQGVEAAGGSRLSQRGRVRAPAPRPLRARAPPTSSSGHLSLDPLPLAGPRPPSRETPPAPKGVFPWLPALRGEKGIQRRGTRGASLGGGATGGDRTGSGGQSAGLCSAWAQWEHQLAELETFPPRGTTVRGRVTPRPDDPWDPRLVFQRGTLGRTGGFRSGSARPNSRGPNLNLGGGRGRGAGPKGPGPPPQLEDPLDRQTAVPAPRASFTFWESGAVSLLFPPQPLLPPRCG
nr:translation initiation factor IF-2-like [Pan troglodytes]